MRPAGQAVTMPPGSHHLFARGNDAPLAAALFRLDALFLWLALVHAFRPVVLRDPHLAPAAVPRDWPATTAHSAFASTYTALSRLWWPCPMMIGPPDAQSVHSAQSTAWKTKRFSSDGLQQKLIDATVPQAHRLGLTIPDPTLCYDKVSGHWRIGPINWDKFARVLAGAGPCNADRLAKRRAAHDNGAWVLEVALAHAKKRAQADRRRYGA